MPKDIFGGDFKNSKTPIAGHKDYVLSIGNSGSVALVQGVNWSDSQGVAYYQEFGTDKKYPYANQPRGMLQINRMTSGKAGDSFYNSGTKQLFNFINSSGNDSRPTISLKPITNKGLDTATYTFYDCIVQNIGLRASADSPVSEDVSIMYGSMTMA